MNISSDFESFDCVSPRRFHASQLYSPSFSPRYQSEYQKKATKEQSLSKVREEQLEARIGKAAALAKRTAAEKAAALALTDDYRVEDVSLMF